MYRQSEFAISYVNSLNFHFNTCACDLKPYKSCMVSLLEKGIERSVRIGEALECLASVHLPLASICG